MSKLFDLAKGVTRDASTLSERLSRDASHVSEETPARVSSDEPRAAEPDVWAERFAKTESFYQRVGIKAGGEAGVEESVQEMETIARRLHKLSSDPSTHAAFRSKGGITALAGLLAHGGRTGKEAAGAIMHLTYHAGNGDAIREAGAIPALVGLLREGATSAAAARAAGALSNLAHANAANNAAIRDAGGIEPLVAMLRAGQSSAGAASAAGALRNLAHGSAASKGAIRTAGAILPLVALMGDGGAAAAEAPATAEAAAALANLQVDQPNNE